MGNLDLRSSRQTHLLNFCTKGGICFRLLRASFFARNARSSRASTLSWSSMLAGKDCCCERSSAKFHSEEESKPCDLGAAVGIRALETLPLRASAVDDVLGAGIPAAN